MSLFILLLALSDCTCSAPDAAGPYKIENSMTIEAPLSMDYEFYLSQGFKDEDIQFDERKYKCGLNQITRETVTFWKKEVSISNYCDDKPKPRKPYIPRMHKVNAK